MSPTTMVRVVFSLYTIWSTHPPSPTAGGIQVIDMFALHTTNHSPIKWMTVLQLGLPCSSSNSSARGGSKEGHVGVGEVYGRDGVEKKLPSKTAKNFSVQLKVWTTLCRATNKPERVRLGPGQSTAHAILYPLYTVQWYVTNVTCSSCAWTIQISCDFAQKKSISELQLQSKFVSEQGRNRKRKRTLYLPWHREAGREVGRLQLTGTLIEMCACSCHVVTPTDI